MHTTTRPSPTGKALPVPADWQPVIDAFVSDQRLEGKPRTTQQLRRAHLADFARNATGGPFDQTRGSLKLFLSVESEARSWTGDTLRSHRTTLRAFYAWAVAEGHLAQSPAAELPKVKATKPKPRPASDVAYLHALTGSTPRTQLMVHCANDLGLRAKEIAELHSRDIRLSGGRLWLTVHGKGDKDRHLPLPGVLSAMLSALPEGWVFPSDRHPSGHLTAAYVSKLLCRALPADTGGHQLRHRFGTQTYRDTGDLLLVSEMLGHSNPTITQGYVLTDNASRMESAIDRHAGPFRV